MLNAVGGNRPSKVLDPRDIDASSKKNTKNGTKLAKKITPDAADESRAFANSVLKANPMQIVAAAKSSKRTKTTMVLLSGKTSLLCKYITRKATSTVRKAIVLMNQATLFTPGLNPYLQAVASELHTSAYLEACVV